MTTSKGVWLALCLCVILSVMVACGAVSGAPGTSGAVTGQGEPTGESMQATAEAGQKDGGLQVTVIERPGVRCLVVRGSRSTDIMRMSCDWDAR